MKVGDVSMMNSRNERKMISMKFLLCVSVCLLLKCCGASRGVRFEAVVLGKLVARTGSPPVIFFSLRRR